MIFKYNKNLVTGDTYIFLPIKEKNCIILISFSYITHNLKVIAKLFIGVTELDESATPVAAGVASPDL
ncbi:MAG: hypothetical protein EAS52_06410 [Parapedobacter sp.]|nr:MAG: hypothetical protein EAS52_06410 [Parapedobacter sp.]